jgi:hypothetical protein
MERTPHPRKVRKIWLIVVASTGFALALAAAIYLALPVIRARRILAKAESLQIGKSTFSEAQQIPDQIETTPVGACSAAECEWLSGTSNFGVPDWWRGKGQGFMVRIHVKDGLVDWKELYYWIGAGSVISAVGIAEHEDWSGNSKTPRVNKFGGTQGQHLIVHIRLAPSDSTEIRKQYTSFNWNCFWRYQGCSGEHELMPTGDW